MNNVVNEEIIRDVRVALAAQGDAADAESMRAYMKSEMPSYGVKAMAMRAILKSALGEHKPTWDEARDTAKALWEGASHREERLLAIELTSAARHSKHLLAGELPLFESMIRSGAWWDYVDVIATHRVRVMLDNDEAHMLPVIRSWATDSDVWIRRAAIICQNLRKERTDAALLAHCIEANIGRDEFWLRKAIGWALRHYARIDADWVVAFIDEHVDALSPLSKREALKHL